MKDWGRFPLTTVKLESKDLDLSPVVVLGLFSDHEFDAQGLEPELLASLKPWLEQETTSRKGHRLEGTSGSSRWVLQGLGPRDELKEEDWINWFRQSARRLQSDGQTEISFQVPLGEEISNSLAHQIVRELALTSYRFGYYQDQAAEEDRSFSVSLRVNETYGNPWDSALRSGLSAAQGIARSRDFGNSPPNVANPTWMAEQAVAAGESAGFESQVLTVTELRRGGFGGLLSVGEGSRHPPVMVRLSRDRPGRPVVALVGKGVTFDTGGLSLKSGSAMDEMKFDKCGACTLMGLVHCLSELSLDLSLRIYLPLAENMPDGAAFRPGDIIRPYGGPSVEILNTDAEGRLILADAIAWAVEEGAETLVEISTLTGACVVALGQVGAGLWSPSDALAKSLLEAADAEGELLWRMPLWKSFDRALQGQHGDLKNVAGRWGGANHAAAFLGRFTGDLERWAHLDIAGAAWRSRNHKEQFGATGYGVGTLRRWLLSEGASKN